MRQEVTPVDTSDVDIDSVFHIPHAEKLIINI